MGGLRRTLRLRAIAGDIFDIDWVLKCAKKKRLRSHACRELLSPQRLSVVGPVLGKSTGTFLHHPFCQDNFKCNL